jgi:ribosomal protein L12E/L44/L45/RPP1/RPP2
VTDPRNAGVKTLAIQLSDEQHAQLVLISQVEGLSLKDVLKQAVDALIAAKRAEGDFAARAQKVLEDIDREAAARRQAIQALFGTDTPATGEPPQAARRTTRRGGEPTS